MTFPCSSLARSKGVRGVEPRQARWTLQRAWRLPVVALQVLRQAQLRAPLLACSASSPQAPCSRELVRAGQPAAAALHLRPPCPAPTCAHPLSPLAPPAPPGPPLAPLARHPLALLGPPVSLRNAPRGRTAALSWFCLPYCPSFWAPFALQLACAMLGALPAPAQRCKYFPAPLSSPFWGCPPFSLQRLSFMTLPWWPNSEPGRSLWPYPACLTQALCVFFQQPARSFTASGFPPSPSLAPAGCWHSLPALAPHAPLRSCATLSFLFFSPWT